MLIYRVESVDYLKDKDAFEQGYAQVPGYRQVKIDALKRPEDKRLSLGAELLLEKLLREAGFEDLAERRIGFYTESGKPFICHPEQVPEEDRVGMLSSFLRNITPPVHISISHSRNYTMVALSDAVVGCDIEHADAEGSNCNALARRFFSEEEARAVEADKSQFFRLWTLKEAYCKCTETPLPIVLKKNMSLLSEENLKQAQGEIDGYIWSIVHY